MKLWVLLRIPCGGDRPYEENMGHVIRAEDEAQARTLAAVAYLADRKEIWFDNTKTTCEELTAEGPAEVVLTDNYGNP